MTAIQFNYEILGLKDKLYRFALRLTANSEDAKDLLQETFYKAIFNRNKFADNTNLQAWMYAIMRNTFINNYLRTKKEKLTFDATKDLSRLKITQSKGLGSPETELATKEIEYNISGLEDEFKVPFSMYIDGYRYREIADKLHLKLGTVKSRIFFTRKKLMAQLKDYAA